jgi:colanic acid biosynthesis glycosyl transferase WcaI
MKILVSSINFHPDHSGIAIYSTDLAVFLAEKSQQVSMVTGFSYYPRWRKIEEDKGILFRINNFKNIKVYRGYLYVPRKLTTIKRSLHDLSFLASAFLNFFRAGRHNVIIAITPPLLLGLVGLFFKKLWGAKLIIHIQDFQLEAALSLGMVRKGFIIKILDQIDRFIYNKCDLIIPITDGMKEIVKSKQIKEEKLFVVHNWIDVENVSRMGKAGEFLKAHPELRDKFLVAYAGNLGIKQGIETLVHLANSTRKNEGIHYLIIGDGGERERLINLGKSLKLHNLTFLPFMDHDIYYNMLRDIHILFMSQKAKSGNVFFPSKILGIMAQSKPIILSADYSSELSQFISQNNCGLVAAAGDFNTLTKHVEYLYKNYNELEKIGKRCFDTVKQFDRDKTLSAYLNVIYDLADY